MHSEGQITRLNAVSQPDASHPEYVRALKRG